MPLAPNKILRRELMNHFRRFYNPLFFLRSFPYLFGNLMGWAYSKILSEMNVTGFNRKYPPYLFYLKKKNIVYDGKTISDARFIKMPWSPVSDDGSLPGKICLATKDLEVIGGKISWHRHFEDIEDTFALHRWGWIIRLSEEHPTVKIGEWGAQTLEDWIDNFGTKKRWPIWESYSVSERIVNGIIFLCVYNEYIPARSKEKIIKFISEMSYYLINNLEYHGPKRTNNHLLNNARALYIAGSVLANTLFSEAGKKIWINELPIMVSKSGFLREKSSHYHFLITHSVLEVWWFAKETGDFIFSKELGYYANKMVKCCDFFLLKNTFNNDNLEMPLIGDISPDMSPERLVNITASGIAAELSRENSKGADVSDSKAIYENGDGRINPIFYPDDGWFRLEHKKNTIFWHTKPLEGPDLSYHGHNDVGSFCFYINGYPLIIDPGRYDYQKTPFGRYGKTAVAHNAVLINSLGPFPLDWYNILPSWYGHQPVKISYSELGGKFKFQIEHNGFSRINGLTSVCRSFYLDEDNLIIEDFFNGEGMHRIDSFFHFAFHLNITEVNPGRYCIENKYPMNNLPRFSLRRESDDNNIGVISRVYKGSDRLPIGWGFPSYGRKVETPTVAWSCFREFPLRISYKLEWSKICAA